MLRALTLAVALVLPAMTLTPGRALAELRVTYTSPETFRDREFRQERNRLAVLAEFDKAFARLAARYLPAGQDMTIEVLDIDLAGDFEPWNFDLRDVRILRDITPPRIRFRYSLTKAGKVLDRQEVRLSDMGYLSRPGADRMSERYPHDMRQLEDWFRATFAPAAAPRGPKA